MADELIKLYNTLSLIETKGSNTKTMADCMRYIEKLIDNEKYKTEETKVEEDKNISES